MFYLFMTRNGETTCQGAYSGEFGAYAKKRRLGKQFPYAQFEIVDRS